MPVLFKLRIAEFNPEKWNYEEVETVVGVAPRLSLRQDFHTPPSADVRLDSAGGETDGEGDKCKLAYITLHNAVTNSTYYPEMVITGICEEYGVATKVEDDDDDYGLSYTPRRNPKMKGKALRLNFSPLGWHYSDYDLAAQWGFDGYVDPED